MTITKYRWDDLTDDIHQETDENGTINVQYTQKPELYGHVISQRRGTTKSFYHFDGQGSTRKLTNVNQADLASYTYTAFGEVVLESGSATNSFRYAGKSGCYFDNKQNSYDIRRRVYDQSRGQWLSRTTGNLIGHGDELEYYAVEAMGEVYVRRRTYSHVLASRFAVDTLFNYVRDEINPYRYTNNPLAFVDPSGLSIIIAAHLVGGGTWPVTRTIGENENTVPKSFQMRDDFPIDNPNPDCCYVFVWLPQDIDEVGHAAIHCDRQYISYWPGGFHSYPLDEQAMGREPDHIVELCCLDMGRVKERIRDVLSIDPDEFDLFSQNCSHAVTRILYAGADFSRPDCERWERPVRKCFGWLNRPFPDWPCAKPSGIFAEAKCLENLSCKVCGCELIPGWGGM